MISKEVRDYIKRSFKDAKIVCLTGAGISAESGIPTFRGKGGLWEKYDPEIYANTEGLVKIFRTQPKKLVDFIANFYSLLLKAHPNQAHLGLSVLEKVGIINAVITQNIDNLHQQAGSRKVIELHGNAFRVRCTRCNNKVILEKERLKEMVELMRANQNSRMALLRIFSRYFKRCNCGGRFRIDIVLFGEMLPQDELEVASKVLDDCKTLLLIGTSLLVYPAANLPFYAKQRGAKLLEINSQQSTLSDICDYQIQDQASKAIPEILKLLEYA